MQITVGHHIDTCIDRYVSFCLGHSRRGAPGLFLNNIRANTSLFRNSFFVRISNVWNAIPDELESEVNVNVFKNKLKSFFF